MSLPNQSQFKDAARLLARAIKEKFDVDVGHSQALDLLSKSFGMENWHVAKSHSAESESEPTANGSVGNLINKLRAYSPHDNVEFVIPREGDPDIFKAATEFEIETSRSLFDDSRTVSVVLPEYFFWSEYSK